MVTGKKEVYNQDLERKKQRSAHANDKPKNRFRLLDLPEELIDQILKELPRFDYLNFLTSGRSELHRVYFQDRIAVALATEVGYFKSKRDAAFDELSLLVDGWNTMEDLDCEINHSRVVEINSFPGWWSNNWFAPQFITDGLTILLGSGFKEQSLVIFDIATAKSFTISPTELRQRGWPNSGEDGRIRHVAFHSGLLIFRYQGLFCFELRGTTLTRLQLPKEIPPISNIAINKEFVCGCYSAVVGVVELYLCTRDFVLKSKTIVKDHILELFIRDKAIIGLTNQNRSIEIWHIEETESVGTSIKHIRSILIGRNDEFRGIYADLSLSHNLNTIVSSSSFDFYSDTEKFATFEPGHPWTISGCVDRIASQYFAEFEAVYNTTGIIVTFQISNIRLLNRKRKIKICIPLNLGEILGGQMFITTIVLFFASGVARLRLKNHESLSKKVAHNSSSVLVSTRGTNNRKDLPEQDEEEYLGCTDFRYRI